jgi:hypothetical protein
MVSFRQITNESAVTFCTSYDLSLALFLSSTSKQPGCAIPQVPWLAAAVGRPQVQRLDE